MTSPMDSPASDLPPQLARARDTLAAVATWGAQLDNEVRLAAVEAFDIIETGSAPGYPPADISGSDPQLTTLAAQRALVSACHDLQAVADAAPARQALAAAHAARVLTTAGFPTDGT